MKKINIIVAIGKNGVIGKNNDLIWKGVPGDLKRFKEITSGHPIIMGWKTFESIGKTPLPNRTNIVLTWDKNYKNSDCIICSSIDEALKEASTFDDQIFIIGGGQIYKQTINLADRLYLTLIDASVNGDVYFPDYSDFTKVISSEDMLATEKFPHPYKFIVLERK